MRCFPVPPSPPVLGGGGGGDSGSQAILSTYALINVDSLRTRLSEPVYYDEAMHRMYCTCAISFGFCLDFAT